MELTQKREFFIKWVWLTLTLTVTPTLSLIQSGYRDHHGVCVCFCVIFPFLLKCHKEYSQLVIPVKNIFYVCCFQTFSMWFKTNLTPSAMLLFGNTSISSSKKLSFFKQKNWREKLERKIMLWCKGITARRVACGRVASVVTSIF